MRRAELGLYLVTDSGVTSGRDLVAMVEKAVSGGVTMVQVREKHSETGDFVDLAMKMKEVLAPYHVPLIINDRIDVALAVDADGVHIGQKDMPYALARQILGPGKIIGLSIETLDELEVANDQDVDYVAASPVFATPTKTDTARPWGLDGLREFCLRSAHPVVAIGGMNESTVTEVMEAGADGVAVVSAILAADDPQAAARNISRLLQASMGNHQRQNNRR
ncbi:MAG: thiamine phosphate synthase [Bacteroidaceae bacterium]|nr:thiamine phosphate synthase [Bacteroidaceae bacterium]